MKRVKLSLSLKIILGTALVTALVDVGFVVLFTSAQRRELRYFAALPADAIAEAVCRAMLDGNPRQMRTVVQSFKQVDHALAVRIYRARDWKVAFSSQGDEDWSVLAPAGQQRLLQDDSWQQWTTQNGHLRATVFRRLHNEPACQRCHEGAGEVLGVMAVDLDADAIAPELRRLRRHLAWFAAVTVLGTALALGLLMVYLVSAPLGRLAHTMRRVAQGEMQRRAEVDRSDELGQVARDFNTMTDRLVSNMERLWAMQEMAERIRHTLDADQRERIAVESLARASGCDRVMLFRVDEVRGIVKGAVGVGVPEAVLQEVRVPLTDAECPLVRTALERRILTVHEPGIERCEEVDAQVNCWEVKHCDDSTCPAYGQSKPRCWRISGTHCWDGPQQTREDKLAVCVHCPALHRAAGERAPLALLLIGSSQFLTFPLEAQGQVMGVLLLDNALTGRPVRTDEDAIAGLPVLVEQVALALENARLHAQLRQRVEAADRELRQRMDELTQMQRFTAGILRSLPNGLLAVDGHGTITSLNPAAAEMLQIRPQEAIGQPVQAWMQLRERPVQPWLMQAAQGQDEALISARLIRKEQEDLPVEVAVSSLHPNGGEAEGAIAVLTDLTARKELERQVQRMEKMATLGQLAAGLAHEIKNPLGAIANAIQVLRAHLPEGDPRGAIFDQILEETQRMDRAMHDFLRFARPKPPRRCPANLHTALESVRSLVAQQAERQGVQVENGYAEEIPAVLVDPEQISQVLLNIVLNALEATPAGGRVRMETRWSSEADEVEVSIADTGWGMEPETLERIFDPYFTTKAEGTGLGLAIAQRAVEDNGGRIEVQSIPGQGTTFTVTLPVAKGKGDQVAGGSGDQDAQTDPADTPPLRHLRIGNHGSETRAGD